jgi:heme A synthase
MLAGLTAVQGLMGAITFGLGLHPRNLLHIVYGIFAVVFLPGIYFYSSRGGKDREAVFLAAACWIVVVAYIRGYTTGR